LLALERIPIVGRTFRVTQIPIAERAAPSAHFTRGFVPWRLSDDGPGASRTISMSRHPKPITPPDIGWPGLMMATRHRLCHDAQRRLKQINPIRKCPLAIAPRQPRSFLHLQGGAIEGRHHGLHQPVLGNVGVRTFVWFGEEGSSRNPVRRKRTSNQRALNHLEIDSV